MHRLDRAYGTSLHETELHDILLTWVPPGNSAIQNQAPGPEALRPRLAAGLPLARICITRRPFYNMPQ